MGADVHLGLVYDSDDILGRGGVYKPAASIYDFDNILRDEGPYMNLVLMYDFDYILSRGGANIRDEGPYTWGWYMILMTSSVDRPCSSSATSSVPATWFFRF